VTETLPATRATKLNSGNLVSTVQIIVLIGILAALPYALAIPRLYPLTVNVSPANASINIDLEPHRCCDMVGSDQGPRATFQLEAGKYRIYLEAPLHERKEVVVSVPAKNTVTVKLEPGLKTLPTARPLPKSLTATLVQMFILMGINETDCPKLEVNQFCGTYDGGFGTFQRELERIRNQIKLYPLSPWSVMNGLGYVRSLRTSHFFGTPYVVGLGFSPDFNTPGTGLVVLKVKKML
jgi:hypothetical protein